MIYTHLIRKAIDFATQVHEIDQKQKRKGKDISYITHPLTVGIILSKLNTSEEVVCAGILHDTIEDSIPEKKVNFEMLEKQFGKVVAQIILDVTETDKTLSWEERKRQAITHIKTFSHDSLLVKSADIISNLSELIDDYDKDGEKVFLRFNASKDKKIINSLETITAIIEGWSENPFIYELQYLADNLQMIGSKEFMTTYPANIIEYDNYKENDLLECPICKWKGTTRDGGSIQYYDDLMDVSCPNCDKMLLIINYPLTQKAQTGDF